jgi:hypothetical protein
LLPRAVGCGFSLGFSSLIEIHMSISPPHVSPSDHPIRRKVALAYRSTRSRRGASRRLGLCRGRLPPCLLNGSRHRRRMAAMHSERG